MLSQMCIRDRCAAAQVIPYAVLAAGVGIFCALNQHWYGVWGLSDFSADKMCIRDSSGAAARWVS